MERFAVEYLSIFEQMTQSARCLVSSFEAVASKAICFGFGGIGGG